MSFELKPATIENKQERIPTGEEIWLEMAADIALEIEGLVRKYGLSRLSDEEDIKEDIEKALNREHQFVVRVWDGVTNFIADSSLPINLLFDIDETLGKKQYSETEDNDGITIFRPSALRLLDLIKTTYNERLGIGFISTRGKGAMLAQLDDPDNLQPLQHVVDPSLVFSTGALMREIDWDKPEDVAFYGAIKDSNEGTPAALYCQDIIDPTLFAEKAEYDYSGLFRHTGDRMKTSLLAYLVRKNAEQAYMAVDDFPYAALLKKDSQQVRGVHLDNDSGFYL